jgi:hypothetical protein
MKFNCPSLFLGMVLCACIVQSISAQTTNNIAVPSTPAFSILGFEPAAIMRPSNPKELSADILNSMDKNGKLLVNLGIEVAPYWLKSHPALTREKYLSKDWRQVFIQSLMISGATVKDSLSGNNKLGTGFRFKIANGEVSPAYQAKERELIQRATVMSAVTASRVFIQIKDDTKFKDKKEVVAFIEDALTEADLPVKYVTEFRNYAARDSADYPNTEEGMLSYVTAINEQIVSGSEKLQKEVIALAKKRVGLIVELAGASGFYTSLHDKFEKAGLWLNVSNVVSVTDAFNFSARYFFTSVDSATTNFDFGGAYIKELANFSVSIETMGRSYRAEIPDRNLNNEPIIRVDKAFTYRLAAQASYKIAEDISVNLSLGKDFDAPFLKRSGFFSIFGVNYNIFKNAKAAMPGVP